MSKVSLRRLLSKLTAIALSTSAVGAAAVGSPIDPATLDTVDADDSDLESTGHIDREQLDTEDAAAALGRGLALALAKMRPLAATYIAASWSLSGDSLRRLAIANALEWSFPLVGEELVIDHLSYDGNPVVRAAVARAAWVRRQTAGDPEVLTRLSHDPDPIVRAVASAARLS